MASSTVQVCALTSVTVPTRPWPSITVSSGLMPSLLPASSVTVCPYPCPIAITVAATIRYPPRPDSCSNWLSCRYSALLSCSLLSSARSWMTCFCSDATCGLAPLAPLPR